MTPRIPISLTAEDRATIAKWSARLMGGTLVVCFLVLTLPVFKQPLAEDAEPPIKPIKDVLAPDCAPWDAVAADAIAQMVKNSQDAELRQLDGLILHMRRGRQSCQSGGVKVACREYQAIVQSVPGVLGSAPSASRACSQPALH
jgi:hypothetical protein